jgi:hypothetical protein
MEEGRFATRTRRREGMRNEMTEVEARVKGICLYQK